MREDEKTLRLYVKGWTSQVTPEEVKRRFEGLFGIKSVDDVQVNSKKFAHVNLALSVDDPEIVLNKLKATYKHAKWKGGLLEFEKARPVFEERLAAERKSEKDELIQKQSFEHPAQDISMDDLRIAGLKRKLKQKGGRKRARVIVFNDDDDEEYQRTEADKQTVPVSLPIPASQNPAYCCTDGDAGPTKEIPNIQPPPLTQKPLPSTESHSQSQTTDETEVSQLALFIRSRIHVPTPNKKKKKNSSKSILGIFFARQSPAQEEEN